MTKVIFFGNGPLADYALETLKSSCEIIFHARTKEDLIEVRRVKAENPDAHGILASFGVMIKEDTLKIFEQKGILNIHPSLLPKYRGASPIETAIKNGDTEFGVSIMKLVKAMDAGPIYFQTCLSFDKTTSKNEIYSALAKTGADWLVQNLENLPAPIPQNEKSATFTEKLDKSMSLLRPEEKTAEELVDEIRAYAKFPKSKYTFYGLECTILKAHASQNNDNVNTLSLHCKDSSWLVIDELQPNGRKSMDAKSFLNGYGKNKQ